MPPWQPGVVSAKCGEVSKKQLEPVEKKVWHFHPVATLIIPQQLLDLHNQLRPRVARGEEGGQVGWPPGGTPLCTLPLLKCYQISWQVVLTVVPSVFVILLTWWCFLRLFKPFWEHVIQFLWEAPKYREAPKSTESPKLPQSETYQEKNVKVVSKSENGIQ